MKKMLFVVALVAAMACFVSAGDLPPVHLGNQPHVVNSPHSVKGQTPSYCTKPACFCPPKTCLYYAGDINSTNTSNENALFDIDNSGIGITDAEVWVGVKPNHDVVITGTSGNMGTTALSVGINPIPFTVRVGITSGSGGTITCKSGGNAVMITYTGADSSFALDGDNYYIRKLSKPCKLKGGKVSYLWISPQYNDEYTIGYLEDVEPGSKKHIGWKVVNDDSYFNSSSFGISWQPTWGSGGACGGIGCDAFSISVSGYKTK